MNLVIKNENGIKFKYYLFNEIEYDKFIYLIMQSHTQISQQLQNMSFYSLFPDPLEQCKECKYYDNDSVCTKRIFFKERDCLNFSY